MSDRLPQFPGCKLHWMEQRTDEWFAVREGVLTASTMGAWLLDAEKTKKNRDARDTACNKLASQKLHFYEMPGFETDAMTRGTALEPLAVAQFEQDTELGVCDVGFCIADFGPVGCSPDGLILDDPKGCGFEGKCPSGPKHVQYIRENKLPDIYKIQVHASMVVTGAQSWWFQSFMAPDALVFRCLVERDQFTEDLLGGLKSFCEYYAGVEAELSEIYENQKAARV